MRRFGTLAATVMTAAGLLVAAPTAPAVAAADRTIADWQMNEGSGATVMADSSGNGIDGSIGSAVVTGASVQGETAYRWTHTQPNQPPAKPERLLQADDDRLNPGSDDFAITVRFRTTRSFGNMIQKGQSATRGGYFKWEIPNGRLTCLFRGYDVNGNRVQKAVNSGPTPLNDGDWHTVRCERTATGLTMTIDGALTRRANGPTGSIANTVPLTIGGKGNCDQIRTTCDYFVGDIDYVRIESSAQVTEPPSPAPGPAGPVIFSDDFNDGLAEWNWSRRMAPDSSAGSPAPSLEVDVSGQSAFATKVLADEYTSICVSMDVNEANAGGHVLMRLRPAGSGSIARVLVDNAGRLRVRSDVSGARSGATVALGSGWHTVELCGTIGSSSSWDLYRDGVKVLSAWTANTGTTPIGRLIIGDTSAKTWTASIDTVVVDQTPG